MSDLISDSTNDLISRQAAIRVASGYCSPANVAKELAKLPSAQPDWDEMLVICDCCGHAIRVRRTEVEHEVHRNI